MRRWTTVLATLALIALALSGCRPLVGEDETLTVYATFYPIYALTDALMDGVPDARLHCLVQPQDGCLRDYRLSEWDARLLAASADAVVMGGRGLESFESALFAWGDGGPAMSAVLYNLELYSRSATHARDAGDSHLDGVNPHLYMSVDGARRMVESIAAALMTLDPRYEAEYAANAAAADGALEALSEETRGLAGDLAGEPVVLMNEALIYVARDYGLEVAEWIDRESGSSFYDAELEDCLERLGRCGAKVVLIERQAPKALVDALVDAGYSVARIDVLSAHREGEGFEVYLRAQRENARAIREAFDAAGTREEGN